MNTIPPKVESALVAAKEAFDHLAAHNNGSAQETAILRLGELILAAFPAPAAAAPENPA